MTSNKMRKRAMESMGFLALTAAILIVLNFLAYQFNFGRLDTTEAGTWSLSDASKTTVAELTDEMEIIGYFSEDLPSQYASTENYVRDILGEYVAASGGNVHVRFVHPDEDEEKEEAMENGVPMAAFPDISNDRQGVVQGFAGLAFRYLGSTEAIPTIESVEGLEYQITMKIMEMTGEKTIVGILTGHEGPTLAAGQPQGGPPPSSLAFLNNALPAIYELREVSATSEIDQDLDALLIIAPKTEFTDDELRYIDQYVMRGGSLGVFGAGAQVALDGQAGPTVGTDDIGLSGLLGQWGVSINQDIVMDCFAGCGRVPVQQQTPFGMMRVPAPYPPMPSVTIEDEALTHPAVFRIRSAQLPFVSSLELTTAGEGVEVRTLIRSTEHSWRETSSINITPRAQNEWRPNGDGGPFPLMVALEGELPSAFAATSDVSEIESPASAPENTRVLVSGSSDYFMYRPEFQPQLPPGQQLNPQQLAQILGLAMNNIDWLAAESELVSLRAKTVDDPQIAIPEILAAEASFEQAQDAAETAVENQDQEELDEAEVAARDAVEAYREAEEAFDKRKTMYKLLNMLGIPFGFALFGFIRWRMRGSRRKNMTL